MSQKGYRKLLDEIAPDHETGKQWLLGMLDAGYTLMEGGEFAVHAAGPDGGARLVIKHHICSGRVLWRSEFKTTVSAGFPTPVAAHAAAIMNGLKVNDRPPEPKDSKALFDSLRMFSGGAISTGTGIGVSDVDVQTVRSRMKAAIKGSGERDLVKWINDYDSQRRD